MPGELLEIVLAEGAPVFTVLVLIQKVVIFPKSILLGSAFACFCSPLGFRPQKGEMNISQLDLTVLYIIFFDLTSRVSGESPTIRSLEIAELD